MQRFVTLVILPIYSINKGALLAISAHHYLYSGVGLVKPKYGFGRVSGILCNWEHRGGPEKDRT